MAFNQNPETGLNEPAPVDYRAGAQSPDARRGAVGEPPAKREPRPDVIASGKWHHEALERWPKNDFFSRAAHAHMTLVNSIDQLDSLKTARDPRQTPAAHAEAVALQAEQTAARIEARAAEVAERNQRQVQSVKEVIDDVLKINRDDSHGLEIRARLSAMSDTDRRAAISKAVAEGDNHVMAAVAHGPGFLTGLERDERDRLLDAFRRRHAKHLVEELEAHQRSAEKLSEAFQEAPRFIRRVYVDRSHQPEVERANAAQQQYRETFGKL